MEEDTVLRRSGRGHVVGSVPSAVSVLLWSSEGVEEDTVLRRIGGGQGVGSVPGAVSVLLWFPEGVEEDIVLRRSGRGHGHHKEWKRTRSSEGVEEDTVLVLFLVQSLCSSGPQKEWKGTLSLEGVEEDTVLVLFLVQSLCSSGHQKEWKRTRCWFCSWCSLCAPLVLKLSGRGHGVGSIPGAVSVLLWSLEGVEEDTMLVLFLVQSLCSSGPQKEMNGLDGTGTSLGG